MTSTPPAPPSTTPPNWPHCGHGATADDPVGCHGIHVPGHRACLAHLPRRKQRRYLAGLTPGADLDHRGTPFTRELLGELLAALRDPTAGRPCLGTASFSGAKFDGHAWFSGAKFDGDAAFGGAKFGGDAWFSGAEFGGDAWFLGAKFGGDAAFGGAKFDGHAWFGGAKFDGDAWFDDGAKFGGDAAFDGAKFGGDAWFDGATLDGRAGFYGTEFGGDAQFGGAKFGDYAAMGPLVCAGTLELSGAVFKSAVTIEAAAATMCCWRTRWASTAALRLRHATVDLSDAILEYPVSIAAHSRRFTRSGGEEMAEPGLTDPRVRALSLRGVDAAHLVLTDIDLTECQFAGTVHLDQLRLEGRTAFARPPKGWWRSQRRTLAEEHHWRAAAAGRPAPGQDPTKREWQPGPRHPDPEHIPGPETLAAVYRQLRKALEDAKNEPGAADFYYAECEMRRHDKTKGTSRSERALLRVYWAVSGYGLRAWRALAWLAAVMTATVVAMMLWGLPADDPKPTTTGRQAPAGQTLTLVTDTPDPINPTGPLTGRLTTDRFEKALRTVVNSVVFRSSGQDLTTVGTYTEMASRFAEPVLLALALLAIRNRVKR